MRLKEIRESKGISQRQAALGLNLSPTVYNRYENGIREPSAAMLLVIADYFGVTVDELLGREPQEGGEQKAPRTQEARIFASWADSATAEDRRRALQIMDMIFDLNAEKFSEGKKNDDA